MDLSAILPNRFGSLEVLTLVVTKSSTLWVTSLCGHVKVNHCTCHNPHYRTVHGYGHTQPFVATVIQNKLNFTAFTSVTIKLIPTTNLTLQANTTTLTSPSTWFLSLSASQQPELSRWNNTQSLLTSLNILHLNEILNCILKHYTSVAQCSNIYCYCNILTRVSCTLHISGCSLLSPW